MEWDRRDTTEPDLLHTCIHTKHKQISYETLSQNAVAKIMDFPIQMKLE